MENRNKTKLITGGTLLAGSLLLGGTINATEAFIAEDLGTGAEVRTALLHSERSIINGLELTCGEGNAETSTEAKCGEASCGEATEEATTEHKCGEGSCGEASEETSEEKTSEHKCGEGTCGL